MPRILLIGATGYTGGLIARRLHTRHPVLLAARDPTSLEAVTARLRNASGRPGSVDTAAVDVTDPASLRRLIRPGDAVINTAGPFTRLGEPVVRACVEAGAYYVDTTGEQPWMREMHRRYHDAARAAGVVVVNGLAFEWALGDCAAALAARRLPAPLRELDVFYAWRDPAASRGTRRTSLGIVATRGWQLESGRWHRRPTGSAHRTVTMASGRQLGAVTFAAGEVVTVPRWSGAETVRGWLAMGDRRARIAPLLAPALPTLARLLRPVLEPLVTRAPDPTDEHRAANAFTIRVEAGDQEGARVAVEVRGKDPYGLTADIAVRGAVRALEGTVRVPDAAAPGSTDHPTGVLAPSQLLDPARLLADLPVSLRVDPAY